MKLNIYDRLIVGAYFAVVLAIGFVLRRRVRSSADYLLTDRSLPLWITGIAFMAANLGSLEMMGMVANGAKYGMLCIAEVVVGYTLAGPISHGLTASYTKPLRDQNLAGNHNSPT